MSRFQRRRVPGEEQRTSTLELFYDLVFVFAITQVSHFLLDHLTWEGAGRSLLVLLVVWWAWNYTTWVTNELDPEATAVRGVLVGVMLASLGMAVAIPQAFEARAGLFVGAYVALQVGRHVFLAFVADGPGTVERERATRVPAHFAERFQLFIIIALGESIVLTGATTAELELGAARVAAFALAFLTTAALWWLYFDYAAAIAQRRLELADNRTRMARDAYTYLHVVMVAGVIVAAVGNEVVIAHPTARLATAEVVAVVAGPAIYLLAQALFRLRVAGSLSTRRLGGALACVVAAAAGAVAPAVVVAALVLGVLVAVVLAEQLAGSRRRGRGEPSPLERLEASARTPVQG